MSDQRKLRVLSLLSAALIGTVTTPARADWHTDVIAAMIMGPVVSGTLYSMGSPELRRLKEKGQKEQAAISEASASMKKELGTRYDEVIAAMANHSSPDSIAWIQEAGPVSREAFNAYVRLMGIVNQN